MSDEEPGRRARTRERLISAAAMIVGEAGFQRFALEAVAARAGVTRRTIYDHFRDKDELIAAVVLREGADTPLHPEPGEGLKDYLRRLGDAILQEAGADPARARARAAFQLYVLTHDALRRRAVESRRQRLAELQAILTSAFGVEAFGTPPDVFVRILLALTDSLVARRQLAPEDFPPEVVYAALDMLAPGGERTDDLSFAGSLG